MKQTAVEWLVEQLKTMDTKSFNRLIQIEMSRENFEECFDQAKEMEKERMIEFTNDYVLTQCNASFEGNVCAELSAEEYYELTFKSE